MGDYNSVLAEVQQAGSQFDVLRRQHLKHLETVTGRNVILYYSGWLQKTGAGDAAAHAMSINDSDINGFMSAISQLDTSRGLDLILHTPGGDIAATEALVHYLRQKFGSNIRAIVPQLAMSAGTMIALSTREILMGKHSSLGPIDPQIAGRAAHGIVEEFEAARTAARESPAEIPIWQPIIAKYPPALVGDCYKAIQWGNEIVGEWLRTGMLQELEEVDREHTIEAIVTELGNHATSKSHSRHYSAERAIELGIKVTMLEFEQELQDAVLTVHHHAMLTLGATAALKIIENGSGAAQVVTLSPN